MFDIVFSIHFCEVGVIKLFVTGHSKYQVADRTDTYPRRFQIHLKYVATAVPVFGQHMQVIANGIDGAYVLRSAKPHSDECDVTELERWLCRRDMRERRVWLCLPR